VLIKNAIASGIRAGTVRAQYRCWDAPRVTVGPTQLTAAGLVLYQRLSRLDRRPSGEWTREVLEWIRDHPHVVSTRLAEERATDRAALKTDIRKLKALGLTISHDVGYELSPRGIAYLDWLDSRHGTD